MIYPIEAADGPQLAEAIGIKYPGNAKRPCCYCYVNGVQNPGDSNTDYVPCNMHIRQPKLHGHLQDEIVDTLLARGDWGKRMGILLTLCLLSLLYSTNLVIRYCTREYPITTTNASFST
jgi:hypothetical protein